MGSIGITEAVEVYTTTDVVKELDVTTVVVDDFTELREALLNNDAVHTIMCVAARAPIPSSIHPSHWKETLLALFGSIGGSRFRHLDTHWIGTYELSTRSTRTYFVHI